MFDRLDAWAGKLNQWLYLAIPPYMPFTALNTALRKMDKNSQSVLDVGCGKGRAARSLRKRVHLLAGIDAFCPCLEECRKTERYSALVLGDARKLPFRRKSFDVVWCLEVLEHQSKEDGLRLLKEMETIARRQIIISTPSGAYSRSDLENQYEMHLSGWNADELRRMGYNVYGHGHKILRDKIEFGSRFPTPLKPLLYALWVLAGPFVYLVPQWSSDLVATKNLKGSE